MNTVPTKSGLRTVVIRMKPELHRRFAHYVLDEGTTMADYVRDHLEATLPPAPEEAPAKRPRTAASK